MALERFPRIVCSFYWVKLILGHPTLGVGMSEGVAYAPYSSM